MIGNLKTRDQRHIVICYHYLEIVGFNSDQIDGFFPILHNFNSVPVMTKNR